MRLRLMVMAARADWRLLVHKHVEIAYPTASITEHRLGEEPALDEHFTAAGFDVVLIAAAPPTQPAERIAQSLAARPEFPPVLLLLLQPQPSKASPASEPTQPSEAAQPSEPPQPREPTQPSEAAQPSEPPLPAARLRRIYGRKIDPAVLRAAIDSAARANRRLVAARRAQPGYDERYRFGSVMIRGHRCIRQVGKGGMCTVYLAESERTGNMVVLKVFSQVPDVTERLIGFDRFLQEYEIVANLEHEHIVRIHDLGVADDHAYIAMEHCPHGDLRQRMRQRVAPDLALRYLREIASALDAIHSVGVLHRDLKPANIMLRNDDSVCLIDFGLAKAGAFDVDLTGVREIFGTPYYMSPEQGHAELIDARSDLYSLGIIFYEMLTGEKPYRGNSAMEVIYKHRREPLPALPAQLGAHQAIAHKLLAKAPADRFQSARALLEATAALAAGVPPTSDGMPEAGA